MGAGAGLILGGLLSGIGKGAQEDILAQRQTALENLRAQREGANITLKAGYDDARADKATDAAYNQAVDVASIHEKGGLLRTVQQGKDRIGEVQTKGVIDQTIEAQRQAAMTTRDLAVEKLRQSGKKEEMQLARDIEGTEVQSTYTNTKGNLVIVAKGGRVITTNIKGEAPKGGAEAGGDLTSLRTGAAPAPTPTPPAAAAPAPVAARPVAKPAAKKAINPADRENYYTQALTKAQGGDPRFQGLSPSQIKAKVDDALRNQGYDIP